MALESPFDRQEGSFYPLYPNHWNSLWKDGHKDYPSACDQETLSHGFWIDVSLAGWFPVVCSQLVIARTAPFDAPEGARVSLGIFHLCPPWLCTLVSSSDPSLL